MWEMCPPYHPVQVAAGLLVTEVHAVVAAGCLQKQPEQSTSPPAFGAQHAKAIGCMRQMALKQHWTRANYYD